MTDTKQPEPSLERFGALVEAYGSDIERFPEPERAPAKSLVMRSREARRVLEAARAFDQLLEAARERVDCVELESALKRIPLRHRQEASLLGLLPARSFGWASFVAAAVALLGFLSGQLGEVASEGAEVGETSARVEQAELASFVFSDELFSELTSEEGSGE